tara:strand:- start:488 stop:709 length:222 start_codon:yes stop_codon:yes gene_type:complete
MRVVELNLLSQKETLEFELEELLNKNDSDSTTERVNKIIDVLNKQVITLNSLQLWNSYINGLSPNNDTKKEEI